MNRSKKRTSLTDQKAKSIFEFMLDNWNGRVESVSQLLDAVEHFPDFCDIVEQYQSSMFHVFKVGHEVRFVVIFHPKTRFCVQYNNRKGNNLGGGCSKPDCQFFHICKKYIMDTCCQESNSCPLLHDFEEDPNLTLVQRYSLSWQPSQISVILRCSMPKICQAYNQNQQCPEYGCPDLHYCAKFFFRKCNSGAKCALSHSLKDSVHNQWVLDAYHLSHIHEGLLHKLVLCKKEKHSQAKTGSIRPMLGHVQDSQNKLDHQPSEKSSTFDKGVICEKFVWGKCNKADRCINYHCDIRIPYLWQIKWDGTWIDVDFISNSHIERAFCNVEKTATVNQFSSAVVIDFDSMTGNTPPQGNVQNVRRMSTKSFMSGGDQPQWFTRWQWYFEDDNKMHMLFEPASLQATLEEKFLTGQLTYQYHREKFMYELDFTMMTQENLITGKKRKIFRRPVYVTAEEILSGLSPSSPVMQKPPPASSFYFPRHWNTLDRSQDVELVKLQKDSREFLDVQKSLFTTLPRSRVVTAVYRVQNASLWNQFNSQRRKMQEQLVRESRSNNVREASLFHGTDSLEVVRGICINNFDFRVCGKNGTRYGKGAYFARDASYSDSYTRGDKRYMFRARVLVGDYAKGNGDINRPPPRKGHMLYDSCVDNIDSPTIYVVFNWNQCYPEYLIVYQNPDDSSRFTGQTLNHLFTPSSSIQQVGSTFVSPAQTTSAASTAVRSATNKAGTTSSAYANFSLPSNVYGNAPQASYSHSGSSGIIINSHTPPTHTYSTNTPTVSSRSPRVITPSSSRLSSASSSSHKKPCIIM